MRTEEHNRHTITSGQVNDDKEWFCFPMFSSPYFFRQKYSSYRCERWLGNPLARSCIGHYKLCVQRSCQAVLLANSATYHRLFFRRVFVLDGPVVCVAHLATTCADICADQGQLTASYEAVHASSERQVKNVWQRQTAKIIWDQQFSWHRPFS